MKLVVSFGFRDSNVDPKQYDALYDVRGFPNPWYSPKLRALNGLDPEVQEFVLSSPAVQQFIEQVVQRPLSTIAIGCYGGRHRSVVIAEEIAKRTGAKVYHKELWRGRNIAPEQR